MSNPSAVYRHDWRPSRLLIGILIVLTILAAFAVMVSEIPRVLAWPIIIVVLAYGARLVRTEARRRPIALFITVSALPSTADGIPMHGLSIRWRGPLAFLQWQQEGGRKQRLSFWPDTLSEQSRRELRLAAPRPAATPASRSMAP